MKKTCGIYAILNQETGEMYIGSAKNVEGRWHVHRCDLRKRKHANFKLQMAWARHPEESFVFLVLEECEAHERIVREQVYFDELNPEYNIIRKVVDTINAVRTPEGEARRLAAMRSPEVVAKLSAIRKLIPRTDEWRAAQSDAAMGNTNGKSSTFAPGHKHSPEAIAKMSANRKGKGVGRVYSPETLAKMSASAKDRVARLGSPIANRPRDPVTGLILPTAKADAPAAEHTMFFGSSMAASDIADVIVAKAKELASEA